MATKVQAGTCTSLTRPPAVVAKSDNGVRCVVAGKESLRVLCLSDLDDAAVTLDQKLAVGHGGHRVKLSKNLLDGSGLRPPPPAWHYNNKILTSTRNGDLIMWNLDKPGSTKYAEHKMKNHIRSIHKLSCSSMVPYYCITGSVDGDMHIWDLWDISRSVMKIHHPMSVQSLVFSHSLSHPLQAVVGLDNGSIYCWDLQMAQQGQLDRLPMAHTGPILTLDWCSTSVVSKGTDNITTQMEQSWIVSGGLDHTVKVWDLPGSSMLLHIVNKQMYVLHPSCPVRHVLWLPNYPCELALVSNAEFSGGAELLASPWMQNATPSFLSSTAPILELKYMEVKPGLVGETVEIWDVCRRWIAKWTVNMSVCNGGVTGMRSCLLVGIILTFHHRADAAFCNSHVLLAQHMSGTFAQVYLRHLHRPIDTVPRWHCHGMLSMVWMGRSRSLLINEASGRYLMTMCGLAVVHPDWCSFVVDRRSRIKTLGDKSCVPGLQNMGMYVYVPQSADAGPDVFVRLAKSYVVPDKSRKKKEVCALNAEVVMQAGNVHAAQAWILLGSLLTDVVPESVITSLPASGGLDPPHPLIHSASAPGALPLTKGVNVHSAGSKPASYCTMSAYSTIQPVRSLHSPSHSCISHQHVQTARSISVNGASPASDEDHKHAQHLPDQPPPPTKPPPNLHNLMPASSSSLSPWHIPLSLPPTPVLLPTMMMTPTMVSLR
ncbi:hypothetical protein JVT61DRAFT_13692 [Boletus reticuloceps]|uniref:Uncharacterized protein n=1 Tax=Boletus reticuloceps TaxID=495285 RepID=A0A8I2YU12_9AGAM|nr:hypothetical protein JVT61DRAFT_13692 [Boletus reticuloceps]